MTRPSGLGRGLGALIPTDVAPPRDSTYQVVAVTSIDVNPYQPRETFDAESLDALTKSISELGVLQPLLVRKHGDRYELIAGERRLRAAIQAGLDAVPVILRDADDVASLEQALVENLHREDLNALEEAAAYQQLVDEFTMTQEQVAKRVGKSRSAVANTIRLLGLPTTVQRLVAEDRLSAGHARALLSLNEEKLQESVAQQVVVGELTVRATEELVRSHTAKPKLETPESNKRSVGSTRDPAVLELESLLSDRLDTTVGVSLGAKRGKVTIDFADLDDLERIYRIIAG
ncbi:MAG: ParB/RepB/Spo0J family partition protein [Acidimicrobiales bacterium]|nr:ParB/RepB/Spo0J family partition protein [Acidimicrobiia bacterium]NNC79234.1 ParB/RepB/Spo0J family partition protein [Acidimicrobiales bacterium]